MSTTTVVVLDVKSCILWSALLTIQKCLLYATVSMTTVCMDFFSEMMPKWTWNTVVADMITTKEHCCAWGQVRLEARKIMENKS